ncbi:MAG: hypothetical protein D6828_01560 [Nitrospirae bacterium]|nr:MAG: hypothetical protein D6828_01560 [Nitrospirota bacterium]
MEFFDHINPLNFIQPDKYFSIWRYLFSTIFNGFWARVFAVVFLVLAFWFGVRRQSFQLGCIFFLLAVLVTYGGIVLRIF